MTWRCLVRSNSGTTVEAGCARTWGSAGSSKSAARCDTKCTINEGMMRPSTGTRSWWWSNGTKTPKVPLAMTMRTTQPTTCWGCSGNWSPWIRLNLLCSGGAKFLSCNEQKCEIVVLALRITLDHWHVAQRPRGRRCGWFSSTLWWKSSSRKMNAYPVRKTWHFQSSSCWNYTEAVGARQA